MTNSTGKSRRPVRSIEQRLAEAEDNRAKLKQELGRLQRSEELKALAIIGASVVKAYHSKSPVVMALLTDAKQSAGNPTTFTEAFKRLANRSAKSVVVVGPAS